MRLYSRLLLLACYTMLAFSGEAIAADPPFDVRDVREVRHWVCVEDRWRKEFQHMLRMGDKVFPAYEAILSDPKSSTFEIVSVFDVLCDVEADRRRFLKYALSRLASVSDTAAVSVLRRIGGPAEASPLIALLSDEDRTTVPYAARTLADIGGPNELVAMDVWLRGVSHRENTDLRRYVKEYRDKLKKRLDEDKDPKKRAQKIQHCWRHLRVTKPENHYKVHRAVWYLTANGTEAVTFLKDRVSPVPATTQKHFDQLLADLDGDNFDHREAATRELSRGVVAESILRKALANSPSLELRRRLETILEDLPNWTTKNPELLRSVRAIWALQQIGTPEARVLLEKLAAGAPSAQQTQKAKDALRFLDRLKKR